jgi:hypothetical protein
MILLLISLAVRIRAAARPTGRAEVWGLRRLALLATVSPVRSASVAVETALS